LNSESTVPLVSSQRWKLWLSGVVLAAVATCYLVPQPLAAMFGVSPTLITLSATAAGLALLIGACLSVRCPACGLSLVWHGVSKKAASGWLSWLLDVQTCPRCGHREQSRK
jgi:hypothetical protein